MYDKTQICVCMYKKVITEIKAEIGIKPTKLAILYLT